MDVAKVVNVVRVIATAEITQAPIPKVPYSIGLN